MRELLNSNDIRYVNIKEKMDLLQLTDVSTERQNKNGTIVWRLPFKSRGRHIEYASFTTGYVRNQGNQCHSNWQCNKRFLDEPTYHKLPNGDYRKHQGKAFKMIPLQIDRLEFMINYIVKNEFIKKAKEQSEATRSNSYIKVDMYTKHYNKLLQIKNIINE